MLSVSKIYRLILKDGLRQFKFKNSEYTDIPFEEQKGAIFGYRTKKNMTSGKGIVMTSLEAVTDNKNYLTHWTPNVYRFGTYSQKNPRITKGHSETNLRQINTFYIDFDIKHQKDQMTFSDILVASIDLGFMPTLILKTENGYQAYFVLKDAAYVTASSDFKVISVAKLISQNLRAYFNKSLPVDMTCNHFGIARLPRTDNIEYFDENHIYTFAEWFSWSMQQDYFEHPKKPALTLLSGTEGYHQIDEPWYRLLKTSFTIKGEKSLMGRNNTIFTLALACYSSGVSESSCQAELSSFNDSLSLPMKTSELMKIISSAYSGKYEAASRDFIKVLCQTWVDSSLTSKDLFIRQGWYKFKKSRDQRQRSHFSEWREDLLGYIIKQSSASIPYLKLKKKDIIRELGIPERSLDYILKTLQSDGKILYRFKPGRQGGILIALVSFVAGSLINQTKEAREAYYEALSGLLGFSQSIIPQQLEHTINALQSAQQLLLFELDIG